MVHCNVTNIDYQQDSGVFYAFVPLFQNKSLGQLLAILPKFAYFWKTFNSEFPFIEVWFTDQNSQPLEMKIK